MCRLQLLPACSDAQTLLSSVVILGVVLVVLLKLIENVDNEKRERSNVDLQFQAIRD